jgi:hypothetical protein
MRLGKENRSLIMTAPFDPQQYQLPAVHGWLERPGTIPRDSAEPGSS